MSARPLVFFAHGMHDAPEWLASAKSDVEEQLRELTGKPHEVVLARDDYRQRYAQEGGWANWTASVSGTGMGGQRRFAFIVVPRQPGEGPTRVARGTAAIISKALSRSMSVALWNYGSGPVRKGVTFQRVMAIRQISESWVDGWVLDVLEPG